MQRYSMTCSCGFVMALEAESRDAAIGMLQAGMNQAALDEHFAEYHDAAEQKPTVEQAHEMIAQLVA